MHTVPILELHPLTPADEEIDVCHCAETDVSRQARYPAATVANRICF
jgi:hypothetical protein